MSNYNNVFLKGYETLLQAQVLKGDNEAQRVALFEASVLFELVVGKENFHSLKSSDEEMPQIAAKRFLEKVQERIGGRPLQYIVGVWPFYNEEYFVGEGVLIPRSDTEILVEKALEIIKALEKGNNTPLEVLDLCSGSGCVAISIKKNSLNTSVTAVELSESAALYLEKNKKHNKADITLLKGDVKEVVHTFRDNFFDMIVSNPPYVTEKEYAQVSGEVKQEPEMALLAEKNGLDFYEFFVKNYTQKLKPGGYFLFEIGYDQKKEVEDLLLSHGFEEVKTVRDYSQNPRVVIGRKKEIIV